MWNIQHVTKAYALNGLSTQFQFLFSFGIVFPSDSSYRTDLADLCDFKFKQTRDPDPYHVVILRVGVRKSIKKIRVQKKIATS